MINDRRLADFNHLLKNNANIPEKKIAGFLLNSITERTSE